jgi:hypothetical protein
VGATTTEPVRNEIAEAVSADTRIWAILLPSSDRDTPTTQLLDDVRVVAKTGNAGNAAELRELLALSFSDEIIRGLRGIPGMTRLAQLEQIGRRSRERMVNRWVAAGLDRAEAIVFADDESVGSPAPVIRPDENQPFLVAVGDVGSGKSVAAERSLQFALREARERVGAAIPMLFHVRDAQDGLERLMHMHAGGLGDIRRQGAYAIIDGADEASPDVAARVIEEAREFAHSFPQTRILITSRPTAAIRRGVTETVDLPLLTDTEATGLVGRISGQNITPGMQYSWPESIRDAVRRPLFAIVMGLKRRGGATPQSKGELLAALVTDVVENGVSAEMLQILRRLACLVTENQGPIDRGELGSSADRLLASASRIVREDEGKIDFALPILAQWFAADALIAQDITVTDLLTPNSRLDRWRYALAIALSTGPGLFVDATMQLLTSNAPAFSADIVEDVSRHAIPFF